MTSNDTMNRAGLKPGLPAPDPLLSNVPGTWAYSTVTERLPTIARKSLEENAFPVPIAAEVRRLIDEIPQTPIRFLRQAAPDAALWAAATEACVGQDWRDVPWFFSETYFYRRLLEATGYFAQGEGQGLDPFAYQKREGLLASRDKIRVVGDELAAWNQEGWQEQHLAALLTMNLWGNRADLSLWPADAGDDQPLQASWQEAEEHTLVDDTKRVAGYLAGRTAGRIDVLVDNAGLELVTDLALADYVLASGAAERVQLHLKIHPTFVSDAMKVDVQDTMRFLAEEGHEATAAFGQRLLGYVDDARLVLKDHPFWTSPFPFWDMPQDVLAELSESQLIISKGDANYRRLLGDRHWPFTTSFQAIMSYAPAPLLALRSLKSELAVGLREGQVERLNREDPEWMVNGKWGVMQFVE